MLTPDAPASATDPEDGTTRPLDGHAAGAYGSIEEWVRLYSRELHTYAYRIVGDTETAADCVQDAFVRAYRSLARSDEVRQPRAWLYRITHNISLNALRSRQREAAALARLEQPPDRTDDGHDARATGQALAAAIAALPAEELDCVRLRYQQDLTDREISDVLEIPLGTVKTRLRRARRRLAEAGGLEDTT